MKNLFLSAAFAALLLGGYACKNADKNKQSDTTTTVNSSNTPATETAPPADPVAIEKDEALRKGVNDATKDVKGLSARVDSGVVYLSGTISRQDNVRITPTLSSLHPKRIDRQNLTIK